MRRHYVTNRKLRPHRKRCCRGTDVTSGRLLLCAHPDCHTLTAICSRCDRGQIYCSRECSRKARGSKQREANKGYQDTEKGRKNHAERARRYRERKRKAARINAQGAMPSEANGHDQQPNINHAADDDPPLSSQKKSDVSGFQFKPIR